MNQASAIDAKAKYVVKALSYAICFSPVTRTDRFRRWKKYANVSVLFEPDRPHRQITTPQERNLTPWRYLEFAQVMGQQAQRCRYNIALLETH